MPGLIVFDPDNPDVGLSTGDDVAVNTHLDIESDTLYFTDGLNIYEWEGDATAGGPLKQTYIWRSGEVRLPYPVNLGAALVEAELYSKSIGAVAGDDYWTDVIHLGKWEGTDGATAYTELAQSDTHLFSADAQLDTAQFNYGTSSILLDGTGDAVSSIGGSIYQLATTDDAVVEGFVRFAALPTTGNIAALISHQFTDAGNFQVELFNNAGTYQLRGQFGLGGTPAGNITTPTLNTWYYFSAQRRYNGGTPQVDLYWGAVSGGIATRVFTGTSSNNPGNITGIEINFGAYDNTGSKTFTRLLNGWLDDTRVTKAARYGDVSSYTIPSDYPEQASQAGTVYGITFRLYADGVLKHTQVVTDDEPFSLPGGYLSNIYSVEIESALPVTRVSVAEDILELSEG
jgi:hypothetical protein